MAGIPPERHAVGPRLFLCLLTAGWLIAPHIGLGQSVSQSGTAVRFQILYQKRVYFGQHSITLNRVAPPVFPPPVPTPTPAPVSPPPNSAPAVEYDELLFFGATVYDHQFTVVEGFDQNPTLAAVSNVDFDVFGIFGFALGDTFYDIFMALDDESSKDADPVTAGWLAEARGGLSASVPGYIIVSGTASAQDIQDLNALHTYFAENGSALVQQYKQEQAENAARALQLKLHPPVRPNTVINYWPIKSSVYLPVSSQ